MKEWVIESYRLRRCAAEVALCLAVVAFEAVELVLVGAVWVIRTVAPAARWLARRVADLIGQLDQVGGPTERHEPTVTPESGPWKGFVVKGEVVSIREEKVK